MNSEQKQNLIILANGLMNEPERPDTRFDMSYFAEDYSDNCTDCGAVGCAIGHAPFYGIEKFRTEVWSDFSTRTLIDYVDEYTEWSWCFDCDWSTVDNSKRGAAQRIIYMLQYGLPPDFDSGYIEEFDPSVYQHIDGFCEYWLKENMQ